MRKSAFEERCDDPDDHESQEDEDGQHDEPTDDGREHG